MINLKCFFGHDYKEIGRHSVCNFGNKNSKLPTGHTTNFLFRCSKCQNTYSKSLNGYFDEIDDGGDDDRDSPVIPVLSPDDYYEKLTKE